MSFLHSFLLLLACIGLAFIFFRGLLGVMYEIADWTVKKLDSSD